MMLKFSPVVMMLLLSGIGIKDTSFSNYLSLKCRKDEDCIKHTTAEMEEQLVCHEGFCFGVPFFYHVEEKCDSDQDCRFYYKCHIPEKKSCKCKTSRCQEEDVVVIDQNRNETQEYEFNVDEFEPFPTGH